MGQTPLPLLCLSLVSSGATDEAFVGEPTAMSCFLSGGTLLFGDLGHGDIRFVCPVQIAQFGRQPRLFPEHEGVFDAVGHDEQEATS